MLRARAEMLTKARSFFAEKGVMEVDVPILCTFASVDVHIDLIEVQFLGKKGFLHSSPEYGMKRLLAEGAGDIYQISHVFRDDERGERHNPEFTMVEWYRCGMPFEALIEETLAFITLFLDHTPDFKWITYHEAFEHYVGHFPTDPEERDHLFAFEIEPHLQQTVIYAFPPEQAALAKIGDDGKARRFEVFYQGMELANGYDELTDGKVQRARLEKANEERLALGKKEYPADPHFLAALERGIPECCGVAVGFDRLMMLKTGAGSLQEILTAFTVWKE